MDYKGKNAQLDMRRVKFMDESHRRGSDCFSKLERADPFTGEVPPIVIDPSFRMAFTSIGFCGIDEETFAFNYYIHKGMNCVEHFISCVKLSIEKGFLHKTDMLAMDNANSLPGRGVRF